MNKMATVLRDNLHLLTDTADADAASCDTAAPAERPDRAGALGRNPTEPPDARNPFTSDPPSALSWSVRHFGVAGLLGGAIVTGLLRLVRGSKN
jgi:hypothetical protein